MDIKENVINITSQIWVAGR